MKTSQFSDHFDIQGAVFFHIGIVFIDWPKIVGSASVLCFQNSITHGKGNCIFEFRMKFALADVN